MKSKLYQLVTGGRDQVLVDSTGFRVFFGCLLRVSWVLKGIMGLGLRVSWVLKAIMGLGLRVSWVLKGCVSRFQFFVCRVWVAGV